MIALFLVLMVSLVVAGLFLGGFLWSVKRDQFEDKEGTALRMLYEDGTSTSFPEITDPATSSPSRI